MMLLKRFSVFFFVFFLGPYVPGTGATTEIFSAVTHMKHLLTTENQLIENLDTYLEDEEKRLANVRAMLGQYKAISDVANEDRDAFLTNPINAFLLLKRLTSDFKMLQYLTKDASKRDQLLPSNVTFPTNEDFRGALDALLRLQKVYKLNVDQLSGGNIPSTAVNNPDFTGKDEMHRSQPLSANDCFDLGVQAYNNEDYSQAIVWMEQALKQADKNIFHFKETNPHRLRVKIMEYLSFSFYKDGYINDALDSTHKLLEYDPMNEQALRNVAIYQTKLDNPEQVRKIRSAQPEVKDEIVLHPEYHDKHTWTAYEALCRGEQVMSPANFSKLGCFYLNTRKLKDPYFLLWKIPVEEASKYPHIVQFHDVITDAEIEVVKTLSEARLKRATVRDNKNSVASKIRISQSYFVYDSEDEVIGKLTRRIQGITGLTMSTAEALQVGNYGLGGFYAPHLDHTPDNLPKASYPLGRSNRIATWMFYMSDVISGGATVFPAVGAAVWPRKGSAAFWYNLRSSGNGDSLTRHAGCPVLVGNKWVSNKWIHEEAQEFLKPCHTQYNQFLVVDEGRH